MRLQIFCPSDVLCRSLSLVSGAHLEERWRLLHDPQQQVVDVVLEVSHLELQLLQLGLPLVQQRPLLLAVSLLLLHVHLLLQQQCDQLHVGQLLILGRVVHSRQLERERWGREGERKRGRARERQRERDMEGE